jgi:hypothetical protein
MSSKAHWSSTLLGGREEGLEGWRGLYDQLISTRIFTLTLNEIFM